MNAFAMDRASPAPAPRPAAPITPEQLDESQLAHLLGGASSWLLSSIPQALPTALFGDFDFGGDEVHGKASPARALQELPAASTPQRQGQDPRIATRHFPSPWLREQLASPQLSSSELMERAKARGKSPVAAARARSVLGDITNSSPSRKSPAKQSPGKRRAAVASRRPARVPPLPAAASPCSSTSTASTSEDDIMVNVPLDEPEPSATPPPRSGAPGTVGSLAPAAPLAAVSAGTGEAQVPDVAEAPSAGASATEEKRESEAQKQARLEGLKAELRLLQLFAKRKSAASNEGCPERVRLSVGSMQTKAAGAEQWSDVEPTIVVVEVRPVDGSATPDQTIEHTAGDVSVAESPVHQSVSVLRPAVADSAEDASQKNAEKEHELARLKGPHLQQPISPCQCCLSLQEDCSGRRELPAVIAD